MATIPLQLAQRRLDTGNAVQYPQGSPIGGTMQDLGSEFSAVAERFQRRKDQQEAFDAEIARRKMMDRFAETEAYVAAKAAPDGAGLHDAMYGQVDPRNGQVAKPGLFDALFDDALPNMPESQRANFIKQKETIRAAGSERMAAQQVQRRKGYEQAQWSEVQRAELDAIAQSNPSDTVAFNAARQRGLDVLDKTGLDPRGKVQAEAAWRESTAKTRIEALIAENPKVALSLLGLTAFASEKGNRTEQSIDNMTTGSVTPTDNSDALTDDGDHTDKHTPDERIGQASLDGLPADALLADLSPGSVDGLVRAAHAANAENLINAVANISLAFQNAPQAFANTGNYAGVMPGPEAFASVYGVDEGGHQFARFDQKVKVGQQVFDIRAMSNQEIQAHLLDAAVSAGHSQESQSQYQITSAAAQQVLDARSNDPAGQAGRAFPEVNVAWRAVFDQGEYNPATVQKALTLTVAAQQYLGITNIQPVPRSVLKDLGGLPQQDIKAKVGGLLAGTADPDVKVAMSRQFADAGLLEGSVQAPEADRFGYDDGHFGQDDGFDHEQIYSYDGLTEKSESVAQLTPDERIGQSSQDDLPIDVLLANLSPAVLGKLVQTARGPNAERLSNTGANVETASGGKHGPEQSVATFGVEEGGRQFETLNGNAGHFGANLLTAKGNRKKFVNAFYQAGKSAGLTDTQARLMAAQAAHESGSGKHAPGFNYFGIKAGKSWKGETQRLWTHEEINGRSVRVKQVFRKYATPEGGIRDRIAFMQRRFGKANDATDIDIALAELQHGKFGAYATDSNYAKKLRPYLKELR